MSQKNCRHPHQIVKALSHAQQLQHPPVVAWAWAAVPLAWQVVVAAVAAVAAPVLGAAGLVEWPYPTFFP